MHFHLLWIPWTLGVRPGTSAAQLWLHTPSPTENVSAAWLSAALLPAWGYKCSEEALISVQRCACQVSCAHRAEHWKRNRLQSIFSFSCLFAGRRWELNYSDVSMHFNQITDFNTLSGSKKRLMVLEYMQYSNIKAPAGINPFYDRQKILINSHIEILLVFVMFCTVNLIRSHLIFIIVSFQRAFPVPHNSETTHSPVLLFVLHLLWEWGWWEMSSPAPDTSRHNLLKHTTWFFYLFNQFTFHNWQFTYLFFNFPWTSCLVSYQTRF